MFQFAQNEATANRRRIFFYAVDATDGYTAVTASITSGAVLIVKNGVTPGTTPAGPTFTHISNGLWFYEMTSGKIDTQGVLTVTITGTNIRTVQLIGYVYAGDPMASIPTFPTNFSSLSINGSGQVTVGGYGSGLAPLQPTVAGRTLDVTTTGEAGIDWANIGSPTTTVNFTGTTISTSQQIASVSGSVNSVTTRVTANTDQWNGTGVTGMPMPTYTQPTGFLSASFPAGTIANTTNITAGTITTVSGNVNGSVNSVTNAVTVGTINNDVITASSIANGAIDAATFADSALVIGSAAGTGVKAYLGANSITATVIGSGAIDADAIGTNAITSAKIASSAISSAAFAAGAINANAIAADAITSAKIADSAITIRMSGDGTPSEGRIIAGSIANDVWNAATASYTTAGTFGKLMDILKKANFVIEGTTVAGSTTTVINTGLTGYLTDAFNNQTILFISGALAGTSSLIITSSSGGGVFTLEQALPAAPASGVDFVVLGTHVHGTQEIADVTWATDISGYTSPTAGYAMYQGLIEASLAKGFAEQMTQSAYIESHADTLLGRNIAGGSNAGRLVKDALRALRNKSAIVGTTLTVYAEDDTTAAWTAAVSSSATADPVTGIDPA